MKLLQELTTFDYDREQIKESVEKNDGKLIVRGIIQRSDTMNANGRRYPRDILAREVNNYMTLVEERRATGELDHADDPVVNLKNVSHVITDLWMDEEGIVSAEVEVLDKLPMGKILYGLFEAGIKVGISSRALGSVDHTNDGDIVQDDLHFICWDFVSEPSTPSAWMNSINEGKEYDPSILDKVFSREDRINRALNDILGNGKLVKKEK